jgi:hypothetical protein
MLAEMEVDRKRAMQSLTDTLTRMEEESFPRRFLGTVARETI